MNATFLGVGEIPDDSVVRLDDAWKEQPRANDGKFAPKGGGRLSPAQKAAATKKAKALAAKQGTVSGVSPAPPKSYLSPAQKAAATKKANAAQKLQGLQQQTAQLKTQVEAKQASNEVLKKQLLDLQKEHPGILTPGQKAALTKKLKKSAGYQPKPEGSVQQSDHAVAAKALPPQQALELRAKLKAIQKANSEQALKDELNALGGNGQHAVRMLTDWAGSSQAQGALELRGAAAEAMSNGDAALRAKLIGAESSALAKYAKMPNTAPALEKGAKHGADTLRALSKASQAMYEGDHVVLYRGVYGAQAKQIREDLKATGSSKVGLGLVSAFSEDLGASKQFANKDKSARGLIVKLKIPKHAIVASYRALPDGILLSNEREVLFMSHGSIRVTAADVLHQDGHPLDPTK